MQVIPLRGKTINFETKFHMQKHKPIKIFINEFYCLHREFTFDSKHYYYCQVRFLLMNSIAYIKKYKIKYGCSKPRQPIHVLNQMYYVGNPLQPCPGNNKKIN